MIDDPFIFVVVPVHNRLSISREFLRCTFNQTFKNFEVILVDDGSTDGTGDMVRSEYPAVNYIKGDGHLWWTGAINVGISSALIKARAGDFVLVINDDLEFDENYFGILLNNLKQLPDTILGSVVVDIDIPHIVDDGGRYINWWTAKRRLLNKGEALSKFGTGFRQPVSTLTGRGTLFPVEVFSKVGLYDAINYPHRGDTEFPPRAKRAGYNLVMSYDAVVFSHVNKTFAFDLARKYTWKDIYPYLFDFRSAGGLKFRLLFAYTTRQNIIQCFSFLICDSARILVSFFRRFSFLG